MGTGRFPTGREIALEVNGMRLAVAQNYKVKASRESRYVEAFGRDEPVGTVRGRATYQLELTRVCLCDDAVGDGVDFYSLADFNLVIRRPDRQIIYTGCQWVSITEGAGLDDVVAETVVLVAAGHLILQGGSTGGTGE